MVVTMAQDLVVVLMFRLSNSNYGGGDCCGSLNGVVIVVLVRILLIIM